jgi:hypothetical protein
VSARDAIGRLRRTRMKLPGGRLFEAGRAPLLAARLSERDCCEMAGEPFAGPLDPLAGPLDHVRVEPGRLERMTVPPGRDEVIVCDFWPACGCGGNCDEAVEKPLPRWVWAAWFGLLALCFLAAWLASRWSGA